MKLKQLNWLYKLLGYTSCYKCKKIFRKKNSTSAGMVWNEKKQEYESFNMCKECSSEFLRLAFGNKPYKDPLKKFLEMK